MMTIRDSGLMHTCRMPLAAAYFSRYPTRTVRPDNIFLAKDERLHGVLFLEKGIVALCCHWEEATKTLLYQAEQSLIGDIDFLTENTSAFLYGYTLTDVQLRIMPYENFISLIEEDDDFFVEIALSIGAKSRALAFQIYNLRFSTAEERLSNFLAEFDIFCQKYSMPAPALTQKRIAEALSLHRVTIAKTLRNVLRDS